MRCRKRLGKLNDLETATRLAAELSDNGHLDLAPALGVLANWSEARRARLLSASARPAPRSRASNRSGGETIFPRR